MLNGHLALGFALVSKISFDCGSVGPCHPDRFVRCGLPDGQGGFVQPTVAQSLGAECPVKFFDRYVNRLALVGFVATVVNGLGAGANFPNFSNLFAQSIESSGVTTVPVLVI